MKSIILHDWAVSGSGLNLPHVKLLKREEVTVLSELRGSQGERCERLIQTPCRSRSMDVDMVHIYKTGSRRRARGTQEESPRWWCCQRRATRSRRVVFVKLVGLERMEELTNICFLFVEGKKRNLVILVDHGEVGRKFEESGEDGDQSRQVVEYHEGGGGGMDGRSHSWCSKSRD